MENYDKWLLVYDDPFLNIKRDSKRIGDYGLMIKSNENYLNLPRGTMPEIAHALVEEGNTIIQNSLERHDVRGVEQFFKGTHLNLYYLNAAITKAHIKEEQRRKTL